MWWKGVVVAGFLLGMEVSVVSSPGFGGVRPRFLVDRTTPDRDSLVGSVRDLGPLGTWDDSWSIRWGYWSECKEIAVVVVC